MKANNYKKETLKDHYDYIIIGSGMSGLCCASLLSMEGKSVAVFEKHFKIGGYTHTFKRDNYEWDVGIHYIGGVHRKTSMLRKLFDKITNNNLKWNKMSSNYDRMIFPDMSYDFVAPRGDFINKIKSYFPEESIAIDKYMDILNKARKSSLKYFSAKALSGIPEMLLYKYLSKNFFKYSDITTYDALKGIGASDRLIAVLVGQWGDYGLPPKESSFIIHSMIANHYMDGANYPIGGAAQIAESIVPIIQENGGEVFVSRGVDEINVTNRKVTGITLENGDIINSSNVISSAGVHNTLDKFLKNYSPLMSYRSKLNNVKPSGGYICLHIGFNQTAKDLSIEDTNLWIYPSYDHDKNVNEYKDGKTEQFPLLYLSFASSKDSSWDARHPNTATMEAITFAPFDKYKKWMNSPWKNRGEEYNQLKQSHSEKIINMIYKNVPHLKNKIDYHELSTPLTTRNLANYSSGELYGLDHNPDRFREKWLKPKTPIKGLYLTGQDILTAGVAGALSAGFLTISVILNKNLFKNL